MAKGRRWWRYYLSSSHPRQEKTKGQRVSVSVCVYVSEGKKRLLACQQTMPMD